MAKFAIECSQWDNQFAFGQKGDNHTLIWKHPIEDFDCDSQLIVHENQEAIFFRDGQVQDLFGSGCYTLKTQQLHSEIYFINKTAQMAMKWGTPEKVRFIDPLTGTPLELGASGEMNIQVSDSRTMLVRLAGIMKGISWEDGCGLYKSLQSLFRPLIMNIIKINLPSVIKMEAIDLREINEKLDVISAVLHEKLLPGFEEYGLTVSRFFVTRVVLSEDNSNLKAMALQPPGDMWDCICGNKGITENYCPNCGRKKDDYGQYDISD